MRTVFFLIFIVWCCLEGLVVTAIMTGWAQLLEVLESEGYFSSLCDEASDTLANSTSSIATCAAQDSTLNLLYTLASFSISIALFPCGKFLDKFGYFKARILSCFIYLLAAVFVYLSTLGYHIMIFPGVILTCIGGAIFVSCLMKVCGLMPRRKGTAVSVMNCCIDLSGVVLLVCKLTYNTGFAFKDLVIVYYTFSVAQGILFTFTLFPKSSVPLNTKEDITIANDFQKTELNDFCAVKQNNFDLPTNGFVIKNDNLNPESGGYCCEEQKSSWKNSDELYLQKHEYSTVIKNDIIERENDLSYEDLSSCSSAAEITETKRKSPFLQRSSNELSPYVGFVQPNASLPLVELETKDKEPPAYDTEITDVSNMDKQHKGSFSYISLEESEGKELLHNVDLNKDGDEGVKVFDGSASRSLSDDSGMFGKWEKAVSQELSSSSDGDAIVGDYVALNSPKQDNYTSIENNKEESSLLSFDGGNITTRCGEYHQLGSTQPENNEHGTIKENNQNEDYPPEQNGDYFQLCNEAKTIENASEEVAQENASREANVGESQRSDAEENSVGSTVLGNLCNDNNTGLYLEQPGSLADGIDVFENCSALSDTTSRIDKEWCGERMSDLPLVSPTSITNEIIQYNAMGDYKTLDNIQTKEPGISRDNFEDKTIKITSKNTTAIQKDESLLGIIKSPKYILHTIFISVALVRTQSFVGMLNLNIKRLTSDPDEVDLYLTLFALVILVEVVLCFVPGAILDWKPKSRHRNFTLVLSFFLTNFFSIALTIGFLIPSLQLQILCFILYSISRMFLYTSHGVFIIKEFSSNHHGALFGFSLLIAAVFSLFQFPMFILVEGPCNGDPTVVNVVFLVIQFLTFAHPMYLHRQTTKEVEKRLPTQV